MIESPCMWSEYIGTNNQHGAKLDTSPHQEGARGTKGCRDDPTPASGLWTYLPSNMRWCNNPFTTGLTSHPYSPIDPLNVFLMVLKLTFLRSWPDAFGPLFLFVVSRCSNDYELLVNIEASIVFCLDNVPARALTLFRRLVITHHYALARVFCTTGSLFHASGKR